MYKAGMYIRERRAYVFPLWIYYNMKMRESQILDEWEIDLGGVEKFISWIFVSRAWCFNRYKNIEYQYLPRVDTVRRQWTL